MAVTLAASIGADDKFLLVDGAVGDEVQPGYRFRVDDEMLEFGAFDTRDRVDRSGWYVERGLEGSTAASHAEGADIVAVSDTYGAGGPFSGGGGGDLETILATGNTTGEHAIVMPMGTIDGTTVAGRFQLATPDGDGNIGMFIGMSIADASNGGGSLQVNAGAANSGNPEDVLGGSIQLTAGDGGEGIDGGSITLLSGRADNTAHAGSRVELRGATTTRDGLVFLYLPSADPLVAGALWANLGIVTVSAG
jgi:hypothetical protein